MVFSNEPITPHALWLCCVTVYSSRNSYKAEG